MKNVSTLFIALSLGLAACGGDDGTGTGTDATPTTMTAGDDGTPTGTAGDDGTPTAGDDGTPTGTAGDDGMDDGMMTGSEGGTADDTTGGGGGAGFCAQSCKAPADCLPGGVGDEADWACNEGFCESTLPPADPCDPTLCSEAAGFACVQVDGADACVLPCPNGDECDQFMLECTGSDDASAAYCQAAPCTEGDPCEIDGVGQYGTCTDGVCSCSDDAECTIAGQACNPG